MEHLFQAHKVFQSQTGLKLRAAGWKDHTVLSSLIPPDASSWNKSAKKLKRLETSSLSRLFAFSSLDFTSWESFSHRSLWSGDTDGSFYPATLNEGRNSDAWVCSSLITPYLKFTAWSERELSVHPCCLHSFSSERWTWTSSDRTQVNVYLSPFLSSWEFVLHPDRKPLASPLTISSGQLQHCQNESRNHKKTRAQLAFARQQEERTDGQYLWKNEACEL